MRKDPQGQKRRAANGKTMVAISRGKKARRPGRWRGRVIIARDFSALPSEILDAFDGEKA